MAELTTGNLFKLFYCDDPANSLPVGPGVEEIKNLSSLPTLQINSQQVTYETYESEYDTVLLNNKSISPFDITVNYVPDEASTVFLDQSAKDRELFQIILNYRQTEGTLTYAIVSGHITGTSTTGDKDSVVRKSYTFTPLDEVVSLRTIDSLEPLYEGSYGVGSNGVIPQYQPDTPEGNSFIKIPSSQAGNPAGADMMGIGLVDGTSVAEFAVTKSGTLSLYAKNASTAWTRILTATQIGSQYVPITRTVNGKPLSGDITLNSTDTGSLAIANNLSDVASAETARTNLGVYSTTEIDTKIDSKLSKADNLSDLADTETARTNLDVYSTEQVDTKLDTKLSKADNLSDLADTETARDNLDVYSTEEIDSKLDTKLSKANNLSDVANTSTARTNLDVYSKTEVDTKVTATNTDLSTFKTTVANTYVPKTLTVNGKALTGNIVLAKGDVGLGNVTNDAQLKIASNLSDLNNVATARTNLGLGTAATYDVGASGAVVPLLNNANTWGASQIIARGTLHVGRDNTTPVGFELGSMSTATSSFMDFHSSGTGNDYDARILASDGTSTAGEGNLTFTASNVTIPKLTLNTALPVSSGGTGGINAGDARINLVLDRFQQSPTETMVKSPNGQIYTLVKDNGVWGAWSRDTNAYRALGVEQGGTGALTAAAARTNLGLGSFITGTGESQVKSPDGTKYIFVNNDGRWGTSGLNPLPIANGGTGGTDKTTAAAALGTFYLNGSSVQSTSANMNDFTGTLGTAGEIFNVAATNSHSIVNWPVNVNGNNAYGWGSLLTFKHHLTNGGCTQFYIADNESGEMYFRMRYSSSWRNWARFWTSRNTTIDANGFVKSASPIVKLYKDQCILNDEAEGVTMDRTSEGVYNVYGTEGLNKEGWTIEIPQDINGNRLCFVETDFDETTKVLSIKTFTRKFDINTAMIVAGESMDIPQDRWVDLRVEMPEDSIWNKNNQDSQDNYK